MESAVLEVFDKLGPSHWFFRGRRVIFKAFISQVIGKKPDLKILDAGCCSGLMMESLSEFGKVYGLDISEQAIGYCRTKGLREVCRAGILEMPFMDETFDLITAFDVIEHVEDDVSALREARRIIKKGGYLILSVPAYKFMWNSDDDLVQHKRRYTGASLTKKLVSVGFTVERFSYFYTVLFPINLIINTVRKIFGIKKIVPDAGIKVLPKFLNESLLNILRLESIIIKNHKLPFGLFILVAAKK